MSGRYIILFKDTATDEQIEEYKRKASAGGGEVTQSYDIIKGFAATLKPETFAEFTNFQAEPNSIIDAIEPDGIGHHAVDATVRGMYSQVRM
ncbi:hypothetical protein C8F01DRAFT_1361715 [Mycena amicta]|nr:hypothetical protein C8F01DRAFT_1361715 [Mycena amicta]